jgi:hypothetical protein
MIPFHAVGDSYSQAVADLDDRIKGSPVVGHGLRFASIVLTVYTHLILIVQPSMGQEPVVCSWCSYSDDYYNYSLYSSVQFRPLKSDMV